MLWSDLQEAFYLLLGPYIVGLLLPVFVAAGLLLSVLMATSKFWRPLERIAVTYTPRQDEELG